MAQPTAATANVKIITGTNKPTWAMTKLHERITRFIFRLLTPTLVAPIAYRCSWPSLQNASR